MSNLDSKKQSLEAELRALPLLPDTERLVPQFAQDILLISILGRINDLPRARVTTANKAYGEVEALAKQASKLGKQIANMHKTALEQFAPNSGYHPLLLLGLLENLVRDAMSCPRLFDHQPG